MNVLIVDDSEPMRRMLRSFICDLVKEIAECSDGSEALAAYERHRPDLVLMDVKMKELDGLEATARIKAAAPEARIVVVSDTDNPAMRAAALTAGAEDYVGKADLVPLRRLLGGVD
jgi:CheY-like chemotaxis protein